MSLFFLQKWAKQRTTFKTTCVILERKSVGGLVTAIHSMLSMLWKNNINFNNFTNYMINELVTVCCNHVRKNNGFHVLHNEIHLISSWMLFSLGNFHLKSWGLPLFHFYLITSWEVIIFPGTEYTLWKLSCFLPCNMFFR